MGNAVNGDRAQQIAGAGSSKHCRSKEEQKLQHRNCQPNKRHIGIFPKHQRADAGNQQVGNKAKQYTCQNMGDEPPFPSHRKSVEGIAQAAVEQVHQQKHTADAAIEQVDPSHGL